MSARDNAEEDAAERQYQQGRMNERESAGSGEWAPNAVVGEPVTYEVIGDDEPDDDFEITLWGDDMPVSTRPASVRNGSQVIQTTLLADGSVCIRTKGSCALLAATERCCTQTVARTEGRRGVWERVNGDPTRQKWNPSL